VGIVAGEAAQLALEGGLPGPRCRSGRGATTVAVGFRRVGREERRADGLQRPPAPRSVPPDGTMPSAGRRRPGARWHPESLLPTPRRSFGLAPPCGSWQASQPTREVAPCACSPAPGA
jgi:hypothetical protein